MTKSERAQAIRKRAEYRRIRCAEVYRLRDEGRQRKIIAQILGMRLGAVDYLLYGKTSQKPK